MTADKTDSVNLTRLAKDHWRGDHDEHEPPYLVWWDNTEDAWTDGFETGYRAALEEGYRQGLIDGAAST